MKRFNKIALIPAAIAAGLASNAYAGTEACFEIYKAGAVEGHTALFAGASCGTRGAAADANTVKTVDEMSAAYELTKSLPIDFGDIVGDASNSEQQIVYIPTTDIPGGTNIVIKLDGAVFDGNANQIHLVKDDGGISAVASSDGTVDGAGTITFLTKAGITIGAGTRLAFSRVSTSVDPVGIKIANDQCTTDSATKTVTIAATNAKTDGGTGYDIIGGISKATDLVDISAQFYALNGGTTADVDVNAESSNADNTAIVARTEFVFDSDRTKQLTATKTQAIYKTAFYDRAPTLDRAITLTANDHLETQFVATSEPGSTVKMGLYNGRIVGSGSTDTALVTQEPVQTGTTWGSFGLTKATAPVYNTEALDVFTPDVTNGANAETNPAAATSNLFGANYNEMFYAVTNTPATGIMNFNYDVNTHYTLDFANTSYNDHCAADKFTHNIDVNGAVLKVPYAVNGEGNFVRVTNEHDEAAEVTVDVFGESDNGNTGNRKVTAVKLGTVPAKSSVVYFVPELIDEAVSQKSYAGADGGYAAGSLGTDGANAASNANRHTLTFTVTAPRDTVHGVSVQRVLGGSDRVMPVLDQNEWSQ
ncbi:hypothetical protein NCCP2140_31650 [Pseudoalteromonas sp. NCCP-2140]|uniref:hypothetical protein n=1 Tax=Pseudoalteromonas sp. NCCP-2140 TaxID=2942288 RepID=UPI0020409755|nr:hypothetical protein [Pseudoalteromonas sp. NCCP-2140]GKW54112.1 hypothetical protein NCCP2140_31650 [Pseudoalteromonas sp. NCCP-2140]